MRPIRKGGNPVKLPFALKTNNSILAAWCSEVRTCLQQLRDRIPTVPVGGGNGGGSPLQFRVSVRLDGVTYKAKVRPGWVRTISPDSEAEDPVKDWMPTMGSGPEVPLDDDTAPEITVTNGQTIYCRIATTAKGIIEAAPKIEAADTPEAGVHFQPPNANEEGDLYFPLANVTITGSPVVVTIEQIQQGGPIVVVPNLPEIKNIGGKREVFSARTPAGDTYDFRTLEQLEGDGEPIIKELDPGDPDADPPVPAAEEGDTIPFRRIAERATSPQIQVKDGGDVIRIEGNEFDQSFGGIIKNLSVTDGLVTGFDELTDGWWGTIQWIFYPTGGGTPVYIDLVFENGLLITVRQDVGSGGGVVTVPGTEGTPASIAHVTSDS